MVKFKTFTGNICFDTYLNAAEKLGIKFTRIEPVNSFGFFERSGKRIYLRKAMLGVNNHASAAVSNDKYVTHTILKENNLPTPDSVIVQPNDNPNTIQEKSTLIRHPWVVKPREGMGGRGVNVGIHTNEDLINSIAIARNYHKKVMIEEYIEGKNYRILIFKNRIIDVLERIPAYVKGDGANPISELIRIKNVIRKSFFLKPIETNLETERNLLENKRSLDSILPEDEITYLKKCCNIDAGGETRRMKISSIPKENQNLFLNINLLLGLNMSGIDYISPDITIPYKKTKSVINEINRSPGLDPHLIADMKFNNIAAEKILQIAFK